MASAQIAQSDYDVPLRVRLFRATIRPVFRLIFYIICRVKITGHENVPKRGAYLIAINHVSLYEAPFILAFWPRAPEVVGAVEIWSIPGQSTLARLYGGIPVHREEYDRRVFDIVRKVLNSGRPLLIAPEGGRSHVPGMRRAQPGVAFLAEMMPLQVIPVGIVGTTDDLMDKALHGKKPWIEMHIGRPFRLPPVEGKGEDRRLARQHNADLVMFQIAKLLPEDYRGVYGNPQLIDTETEQ